MKLNAYLQFNGQCEEAFAFYEKCLGGKVPFKMTYGESPAAEKMPAEMRDKIIHTRLIVGDQVLMGCDAPGYETPRGFQISINVATPADAERIFKAMSEKATITMPMEETFWAQRFGMLIDQFGIPWMVNCEKKPNA